jgi:hypothetical protein
VHVTAYRFVQERTRGSRDLQIVEKHLLGILLRRGRSGIPQI